MPYCEATGYRGLLCFQADCLPLPAMASIMVSSRYVGDDERRPKCTVMEKLDVVDSRSPIRFGNVHASDRCDRQILDGSAS